MAKRPKRRTGEGNGQARPMLADALEPGWRQACAVVQAIGGVDLERLVRQRGDPVGKARRMAEAAAPANMRVSLAIGLGTSPRAIEVDRAGYRLIADTAHRDLAMVGLRSGETVEADVSERMQDFLARFFGRRNTAGGREPSDDAPD